MKFIARNFRIATAMTAALMNEAIEGDTGASAAPAVKLTRAEKYAKAIDVLTKRIEADTAKLAEIKQEVETAERLASVATGSAIVARIGRAETSKEVNARVLGVKEEESGSLRYKIMFGEGVDTDIAVIQASQIVSIVDESAAQ